MLSVLEDDLTALTAGVWEAFLGMPAEQAFAEGSMPGPFYTSCVNISGGWNGAVNIVLPEQLARDAAGAMFGMSDDELESDEVNDAVGELANIIGGNIKGMIEEPCTLSLPMVAVGENYSVSVPGTDVLQSVALHSNGVVFKVSVSKRRS